MTNEEILKRVIKIYNKKSTRFEVKFNSVYSSISILDLVLYFENEISITDFLFNRLYGFAETFWGKEYVFKVNGESIFDFVEREYGDCNWEKKGWFFESHKRDEGLPEWKYHLQQMAVSENRIKYLEKFIKEETK